MKKIRAKTLWRGPAYCIAAGYVSWYATILLGPLYIEKTLQADGSTMVGADPLRSIILQAALLAAAILIGGFFVFRRMSKADTAVSCGIISALQLIMTAAELMSPAAGAALLWSAEARSLAGSAASILINLGLDFNLAVLAAAFWPMIFVLFGRRQDNE